jgi:type VI secretion system protein ImpM
MSGEARSLGGIYGKVPTFADFVHRRLPMSFVEPWNAWLRRSIAASRQHIPDSWNDAYLTSPVWRFALDPDVAGPVGWLGVLASSVDEMRRSYPITVAISLPEDTFLFDLGNDLEAFFAALEKIALQLIDGTWTPDAATTGLEKLADILPDFASAGALLSRGTYERLHIGTAYGSVAAMRAHLGNELGRRFDDGVRLSGWWHGGWNASPPVSLMTVGLPSPDIFASFLDGSWRDRGWADCEGSAP